MISFTLTPAQRRALERNEPLVGYVLERILQLALWDAERRLDLVAPDGALAEVCCTFQPHDGTLVPAGEAFHARVGAVAQALGTPPADLIQTWLDQAFAEPPGPHPPPRTAVDPPFFGGASDEDDDIPF